MMLHSLTIKSSGFVSCDALSSNSESAEMEIQIFSREIIKPSSSTPEHLRIYNLSLLDQISPPVYVPVILFYSISSTADLNPDKISGNLKLSFSETLTRFYPLSGRIKDDLFSIDCNDNGVSYTEVKVAGEMSMVIQESDVHQLEKLLPCSPYEFLPEISSQEILKIQVNYFECGGVAISICIWHVIGDAATAASFVRNWAEIANSGGAISFCDSNNVVVDCTSIFPPKKIQSLLWRNFMTEETLSSISMKKFVFDGSKLSVLRKEASNGPNLDHPTRVEAVSALIWKAVMEATGKDLVASIVVDLRKRVYPPLPNNCIGNINQMTFVSDCSNKDYNSLAGNIHKAIKTINNEYIRKIHGSDGGYLKHVKDLADEKTNNPGWLKQYSISSWCRFPFYEADFGWGKPVWVTTALINRCAFLLDTKEGQGIEAWIGLSKEIMPKFEQNPGICAYASFTPTN